MPAYTTVDLPDGVVIARVLICEKDPYFYFADANTLQELPADFSNDLWVNRPYGHISAYQLDCDLVRVSEVMASDGWGPLLHDLAMEYATNKHAWFGPDLRENSADSRAVWDYYLDHRPDVLKKKNKIAAFKNWAAAHFLYSKPDNRVTKDLLDAGLLVYREPGVSAAKRSQRKTLSPAKRKLNKKDTT